MTNNARASSRANVQQNRDKIAGIADCVNVPLLRLMWRWPVCEMCCSFVFDSQKALITSCSIPLSKYQLYSTDLWELFTSSTHKHSSFTWITPACCYLIYISHTCPIILLAVSKSEIIHIKKKSKLDF